MKRLSRYYENLGIAKKIFITLLMVSIIPIVIIQLIIGIMNYTILQRKTDELINSTMAITKNSLENHFDNYENVMKSVNTRNTFAEYLENLNNWNTLYYYQNKNSIINELENIVYENSDILGVAVVTNKQEVIRYEQVRLPKNESFCFPNRDKTIEEIVNKTKEMPGMVYSDAINREYTDGSSESVIYIGHQLTDIDKYDDGALGSIIVCVKERDIAKIYEEAVDDTNVTLVCDSEGNILSASYVGFVGTNLLDGGDKVLINEGYGEFTGGGSFVLDKDNIEGITENYLEMNLEAEYYDRAVYEKNFLDGELWVIHIYDTGTLFEDINYILIIIILIGIIVALASLFISLRFYDDTRGSVENILEGMNKAHEGEMDVHIESERTDEFGMIASHFNEMVIRIDDARTKEKQGLIKRNKAEIKALEAQINPHFLYNTLDAINWVAIENEEFGISKMLKNLGIILRYSVHDSNAMVTLDKELEYLKKYIELQQMRFEYAFDYEIDVDEVLLGCKVHKLLFQPLIENSIVHGFEGREGDGIVVEVREKDDEFLMIKVSDNGKGIPPEILEELQVFDYQADDMKTSIGVRNVFQRLKYYYGDKGSYRINSDSNGTCVVLTIPIEV